jgi:uncharacterized membrane protein HdeD (DUF308 family)
MTSDDETSPALPNHRRPLGQRRVRGVLVLLFGSLAVAAPFFAGPLTLFVGGLLLIVVGLLEMLETFRAPDASSMRATYLSGVLSILAGSLLLSTPELVLRGVALVLAGSFLIDGIGKGIAALRAKMAGTAWIWMLATAVVNVGLALVLVTRWPVFGWPVVEIVVGLRMLMAGWSMVLGREAPPSAADIAAEQHPDLRLHLPPHPAFATLNASIATDEVRRRSIDAFWCWTLVIVFFAIHMGRMRVYWTPVGIIDPLVAVAGDVGLALLLAFTLILPVRLAWRKLTRPLERGGWKRTLACIDQDRSPGLLSRLYRRWLIGRLRFARRLRHMRYSASAALRWGLRVGLPLTAILVGLAPLWGLNYFFNTETWASGVWDRWAAARTDTWRENMIEALREHYRAKNIGDDRLFQVDPPGISGSDDFTFLVAGDTGDGGAAQQSLRDQYVLLGKRPDVKFMVISSDVIYPDGAMRDYEHNFYLPFKGFTKPIYAIPGNHDWYDALEGFAANFLEADAARTCMLNRMETDSPWTTTSEGRIDRYIHEAARLRKEYSVSTGWQRGPIFEVQTERFALIAVDTGVLKTVDSAQWTWLKAALGRARGKFTMVLLGHPLYTAGFYQGDEDQLTGEWSPTLRTPLTQEGESEPFTAIHRLLREHEVPVVMAGDMHYFEHCQETYQARGKSHTMHHFVNGGGGAYICVGIPFDWPTPAALPLWTYFPRKDAVIAKLDAQTPFWKMPVWLWVKNFSAWPFSGYITSAAFDHNKAPFFQSFVEVQVLNSKNEVRFLPHAATGRLRWRDLENFQAFLPAGKTAKDPVEFIIKMPPR